jgi:hypothetical protein
MGIFQSTFDQKPNVNENLSMIRELYVYAARHKKYIHQGMTTSRWNCTVRISDPK